MEQIPWAHQKHLLNQKPLVWDVPVIEVLVHLICAMFIYNQNT